MSPLLPTALLAAALAQPSTSPVGEAWVFAPAGPARAALAAAPVGFAEGVDGDWVRVHGDAAALDALLAQGFLLRDRRDDHRLPPAPPWGEGGYHDPDDVEALLIELTEIWPAKAELIDLGRSRLGEPILALRLGVEGAPAFRVVGGHHGDEPPSVELTLALAQALLEEAEGFEGLLDDREVWILPALNPDGLRAGDRYNADGVDLNRNYGFEWSASAFASGPAPFSEPETQAARALALLAAPIASLSLHTGAENIGYVFNYSEQDSVEEARVRQLAEDYAADCGQLGFQAVQGAEWYVTRGDANDWAFALTGALDFTVELSRDKAPDPALLPGLIDDHLPAIAAFLATPVDLRLQLTDAEGRPLPAEIELAGATAPYPSPTGAFHRLIEPGDYTLAVTPAGAAQLRSSLQLDGPLDQVLALDLEPTSTRPEPALLLRGAAPAQFTLPGVDPLPDPLTLSHPGFEPISLSPGTLSSGEEGYSLDLDGVAAGAWSLSGEGVSAPRALLIGSDDASVGLTALAVDGDTLRLEGCCFGRGTRAWAMWGAARSPQRLDVIEQGGDHLLIDLSEIPSAGTVDLRLWSYGRELFVADLLGEATLDPGAPPALTPPDSPSSPLSASSEPARYAACSTTRPPPLAWLALLLPLLWRRRCAPPPSR